MEQNWWKQAVFYEVYIPSFCDGNGDGIGDFKGLTSKLDYLKELGINGIWLTPFYKSPKVDNGYDIADYYQIDQDYGSMADFEYFVQMANERQIKVIADLVLNHTSSEHAWFQESKQSKNNTKRDWYIWRDPVVQGPPNNWESFFGGTAWEYDEATDQYYYHAFAKEQVDLNWANPDVKNAMFDVMKFWLDKGIDGFRLDVINFLTVNRDFKNNPYKNNTDEQIHLFDKDQEGILDLVKEISQFVHSYPSKFLVGEVGSEDLNVLKDYCGPGKLDVVFNFNLGSLPKFDAESIFLQLKQMEQIYTNQQIPTLFFSSHDMSRHISRFSNGDRQDEEERAKLIAGLMLSAKGVPFIYYGDEIGMRDLIIEDPSTLKDVQGKIAYEFLIKSGHSREVALEEANKKGRDKSRSPMQWDQSSFAGFSTAEPWIHLPNNFHLNTVENLIHEPFSILCFYRQLIKLRNENDVMRLGSYTRLEYKNHLIYFIREYNNERVLGIFNFGGMSQFLDLKELYKHSWKLLISNKRSSLENQSEIVVLPNEVIIASLLED
ncbi:alpha-glucosidase [Pullulanibacillus sp. KACC 23026]|uniref:glycoside hydrolase family 13 protein n=1 Tax=Pullulanibacillus sp. KACC 23026 TaxID=3028315 RepID=UPI0023B0C507|nr:alpha-glucosidase [Pullulanibacillus sp. KACC 23026]WEG13373.1 alpha-glucosidase [Pullulanibacillus sp. KACC 23026]